MRGPSAEGKAAGRPAPSEGAPRVWFAFVEHTMDGVPKEALSSQRRASTNTDGLSSVCFGVTSGRPVCPGAGVRAESDPPDFDRWVA